jgi:hypothetical protein
MAEPWKNRIVGHRDANPAELIPHEANWRTHPEGQASGLRAVLDQVGVVQDVVVSKRTGRILDGHLRVDMAIATGQPTIPVVEVDVTEDEERLILATFDALGGMANVNAEALKGLLGEVRVPDLSPELAGIFDSLLERNGLAEAAAKVAPEDFPEVDETVPTEHACPKCGYRWSGSSAAPAADK